MNEHSSHDEWRSAAITVLLAVLLFAISQNGGADPPVTSSPGGVNGKAVYAGHCASCHDDGVDGAPRLGDQADWAARVPEWTELLEEHATDGFINMKPMAGSGVLSREAVAAAAAYMAGEIKQTTATGVNQDLSTGRAIYTAYCAACHDGGKEGAPRLGDDAAWAPRAPFWSSVLRSHVEDGFLAMPPNAGRPRLSDKEVAAAVDYMISWESVP
ncbi:MAG TPA: c-type cytochrome [Gammaproteobacteria bacterium]|nr:c-type cytochrome [Gammaproteobacteria bacterium]